MSGFLLPEREEGGLLSTARLISQAGELGWDWFNRPEAPKQGATEAALAAAQSQRLAQAAARLAGNDDFALLLNHLVDTTILQPVQFVALGLSIEDSALNAARREGENALVWSLLKLIQEGGARGVAPMKKDDNNVAPVDDPPSPPARARGRRGKRGA
ncbi:MAG: hypothetical protein AB1592_12810 [Pseudomonadota bacterium]